MESPSDQRAHDGDGAPGLGADDGFGFALTEDDSRVPPSFDLREPDDPDFTDRSPTSSGRAADDDLVYGQDLGEPFASTAFTELQHFALGIQDGDSQVVMGDIDLRLFLDGEEVTGAFDTLDQFDFIGGLIGGAFVEMAGLVTISRPESVLDQLPDGMFEVRIDNLQLDRARCRSAMRSRSTSRARPARDVRRAARPARTLRLEDRGYFSSTPGQLRSPASM